MRLTRAIQLSAAIAVSLSSCYKGTPATADSASSSSTATGKSFDKDAARREILGNDSAYVRGMMAKNVDTVMCCFANDAVSIGGGKTAKGVSDIRTSYVEAVKANARDVSFQSGGVNFSDDGTMAWDYGSYSQTVDVKGKATKQAGDFLNVWKKVDGKWKLAAEIGSPAP